MRFRFARAVAFKAAVFGTSLVLLGGAGYAAAQPGTAAHAPSRASAAPPPVRRHHHPKPKPPRRHHHPARHVGGKDKGRAKQHRNRPHHVASDKMKATRQ